MSSDLPELSEAAKNLKPGAYRHFKGGEYELVGVARDSESLDEMVVIYRSLNDAALWARPLANFLATVECDGYNGPRFVFVK